MRCSALGGQPHQRAWAPVSSRIKVSNPHLVNFASMLPMIRGGCRGSGQFCGWHARRDRARSAREIGRALPALEEFRAWEHHRETRRLLRAEPRSRLPEVVLSGGLGTEDAFAPFD